MKFNWNESIAAFVGVVFVVGYEPEAPAARFIP